MTTRSTARGLALSAAMLGAFAAGLSPALAQDAFKIGAVGPLTGPAATMGIAVQRGMTLATEEWNAKGGIMIDGEKRQVEVIYEDSQSKPAVGVSAAEKLLTRDGVKMLMGDLVHSSVALALMDLSPTYEVPLLTVYPTSQQISERIRDNIEEYSRIWKAYYNTDAVARGAVTALTQLADQGKITISTKTLAIIAEETDVGRSYFNYMKEAFEADGWKVVGQDFVPIGYTDFYPQMSKLKSLDPDAVLSVFTSLNSGVAYAKQYVEAGPKSFSFGVAYPAISGFIDQAGPAAAENLTTIPSYQVTGDVRERIAARWNITEVSPDHGFGYDIMNVAMHALENAGSTDTVDAITKGFLAVDYKGNLGRWVFDPANHTALDGVDYIPTSMTQIQDGKYVVVWPADRATGELRKQPWTK